MLRREFLGVMGGAAATWPLAVRAKEGARFRSVSWLSAGSKSDTITVRAQAVFTETLLQLGWKDGQNLRIDFRWAENNSDRIPLLAKELVSLKPDVIFAPTTQVAAAFQRETRDTPIVFVYVADPVASRFVANLSHPGGNMTGFYNYDTTVLGKYVELLKELSPAISAITIMFNPTNTVAAPDAVANVYAEAARYHAVQLNPAPVRDDAEIERTISDLGNKPASGLIVQPDSLFARSRTLNLITSLAIRHHVPAIYSFRFYVAAGGLVSYGSDLIEQVRQAASYVDRLLRGTAPSELPVQAPTKYQLIINLKTAKAMNLPVSMALLTRADEVIE
jgi:putative ABC transport system substrate-binding protein